VLRKVYLGKEFLLTAIVLVLVLVLETGVIAQSRNFRGFGFRRRLGACLRNRARLAASFEDEDEDENEDDWIGQE